MNSSNIIPRGNNMFNIRELTHIKHIDTDLFRLIKRSLEILYRNDYDLLFRKANERSVVARFMIYLQKELLYEERYRSYDLDFEYNRNGEGPKIVFGYENGAYPDLIIHRRNVNCSNLLIMEFKTYWNCFPAELQRDIDKIKEFTDRDGEYKFRYGISIVLGRTFDETEFQLFMNKE